MTKYKPYLVTAAIVVIVLVAIFKFNVFGSRKIVTPNAAS